MRLFWLLLCGLFLCGPALRAGETVRLKATADIWLSDANNSERNSSSGKCDRFKIKTIQEMAAIRFDAASAKGREVLSAKLFLHKAGKDMLRYIRVSTVNQDWVEGNGRRPYGPADGSTYWWADAGKKKAWSYPGSEFADVIMGMGQTITTYAERKEEKGGWISVALTPELIYALAARNSDGLAVMDGGNLAYFNNFIHSVQSGRFAPYITVELGQALAQAPPKPPLRAEAAPGHAHLATGAIRITLQESPEVFCWKFTLNGKPVARWRVPYPRAVQRSGREQEQIKSGRRKRSGPLVFYLEDLKPSEKCVLEATAVARGGALSPFARVTLTASAALKKPRPLGKLAEPQGAAAPLQAGDKLRVWAAPGLVKISPERPGAMFKDMAGSGNGAAANAVWNGKTIRLHGCRGEYISYQLIIERLDKNAPLSGVKVLPAPLEGPGKPIGEGEIELYKNWYAKNKNKQWQPAYAIPLKAGAPFAIPDPQRKLSGQRNQSIYVDVYIPKEAKPGRYAGSIAVEGGGGKAVLPVKLAVYDFVLPDRLSFWPELNAYHVPGPLADYQRLVHQHRLAFNPWVVRAKLQGTGKNRKVIWDSYDKRVGPLLSGEAFKKNRRAGVPIPCLYLPFEDSWPTPLSQQTYRYTGHWPKRGESNKFITEHYMKAPYIGAGLSQRYKDAFRAVQKQFIEHFKEKGWKRTEMQCFYGGKNTHRTQYGSNMWWTTDEPYHWDDWLALQFFDNLWCQGRNALGADPKQWAARGDISRPMWQGRVLDSIVDTVYWGGFSNPKWYRRSRWLARETGLKNMAYGSANRDNASNTQSLVALLNVWIHGGNGFLPWQTLGNDGSLDRNDNVGGNALLVPGKRFGLPVVGDLRLKALRDGQQLIEYLVILAKRRKLNREQIQAMLTPVLPFSAGQAKGSGLDNADAMRFSTLKAWQISELRRKLAERITSAP